MSVMVLKKAKRGYGATYCWQQRWFSSLHPLPPPRPYPSRHHPLSSSFPRTQMHPLRRPWLVFFGRSPHSRQWWSCRLYLLSRKMLRSLVIGSALAGQSWDLALAKWHGSWTWRTQFAKYYDRRSGESVMQV